MTKGIEDLDRWEAQDWDAIIKRLTVYAHRRLGRRGRLQDAEDIAMEAIARALDPAYRDWDPNKGTLLWHLQSEVNGIISNRRRTMSRTMEDLVDTGAQSRHAGKDSQVVDRINASEILTTVLEHIVERGDQAAEQVFTQALNGIVEAKDVAMKCGLTTGQVNEARRRLHGYYAVVLRQEDTDG